MAREYRDFEQSEQEVRTWLDRRKIPTERYDALTPSYKDVLKNLICSPAKPTTHAQRKELYKKLCLYDIGGRKSADPTDFMPAEELDKFFSPLSAGEKLPYLYKF